MQEHFTDDTFLARWLSGELTEKELADFKSHADYQSYKKIIEASDEIEMPLRDRQLRWTYLSQKMQAIQKLRVSPVGFRTWWKYAAVAAIIIMLGYWAFVREDSSVFQEAKAGQQITVPLPDGSSVRLNAGSSILYAEKGFNTERTLRLDGEAFFDVQEGSPFIVKCQNGEVTVLGTTFNVRTRGNTTELTCYSGQVGFRLKGSEGVNKLQPGDRILSDGQEIVELSHIPIDFPSPTWMEGRSTFRKVSFKYVVEELERQFDVRISYPQELEALPLYTGGFPHDDLPTALDIVFSPVAYQHEIIGKEVRLFK
ncbi:MAG: FecR domain-containing protein [Bacteroidota bacterium]